VVQVAEHRTRRIKLIWGVLLGVGFPFAIIYPFFDAYVVKHLAADMQVSFDFTKVYFLWPAFSLALPR
jgi:hypothetical protein